jgi:MtN3 and saliva related transmembrane protein
LLTEKFRLFNGVFGASDEVLGTIESGVDFEKRILVIYQECRISRRDRGAKMSKDWVNGLTYGVLLLSVITLYGCEDLVIRDTSSLLAPTFRRSEILGFVAGFGTTFAAVPDLVGMLKRRSSAGMNPRMAGIMGVFQIVWIYYGLLIVSRPVIAWNAVAVLINFLSVGAYLHFVRRETRHARG